MPSLHYHELALLSCPGILAATHVLDDMAVVGDEQECTHLRHIDLHANKTVGVAGQVVKRDALTEVECPFVECLPVPTPKSAHLVPVLSCWGYSQAKL